MKKTVTKKDFWIILGIVFAIAVAFITTFVLLYSCDNNGNKGDSVKKTVAVSELPSEYEYFAPALKLNKKNGKDFSWSQIGFVEVDFHIEVDSEKITPKLIGVDGYGGTKISDYIRANKIIAVVDYINTPYGFYDKSGYYVDIESMECDTRSTNVIYSTQSIKDITSDSFNIVVEKIGIIYVNGTKEISKDYTGNQISENFDFEISINGYDSSGKRISDIPEIKDVDVIFEIKDVQVSFYDYGIYVSWKLTSNCEGQIIGLTVRFADNTDIKQWEEYDFPISDKKIGGTTIRGDFSYENLPVEIRFSALLTSGSHIIGDSVVVTDFEIVNNI